MGLDWNPANKPIEGHEAEYELVRKLLQDESRQDIEEIQKRYDAITISAYQTLDAPRVGRDKIADDWIKEKFTQQEQTMSETEWLERFQGYYVLEFLHPCDGLPRYSNSALSNHVDAFSFRAQFLDDCVEIIGKDLLEQCWESKMVPEFKLFGHKLRVSADEYIDKHHITAPTTMPDDPDCIESHLDIVLCASRWCEFWSARGHPLHAWW